MRLFGVILALMLSWAAPVAAQTAGDGAPQVLTIDLDAVFANSLFGKRITEELRTRSEALAAENRGIEAQLEADEKTLTEQRANMTAEAFRAAAEDFDARVEQIRTEQDGKQQALQTFQTDARNTFLGTARPILAQIMQDRGALVMIDLRSVIIAANAIDITEAAIAAIDAAIGDGADLVPAAAPAS